MAAEKGRTNVVKQLMEAGVSTGAVNVIVSALCALNSHYDPVLSPFHP